MNTKDRVKGNDAEMIVRFKNKKSIFGMYALILLLLCLASITVACQPTPEKEIVVGHQNDDETIQNAASSEFSKIVVPEHVDETFDEFAKLRVVFDADVVVPETTQYPVTEVTPWNFSDEEITAIIMSLAGEGNSLYSEWTLTQDDWLEKLANAKQYIGTEKVTQDYIDYLQQEYEKASSVVENATLNIDEVLTGQKQEIFIKNSNDIVSKLYMDTNGFGYMRNIFLQVIPKSWTESQMQGENIWYVPGEPDITKDDAYEKAVEYLNKINIGLDIYSAEPCSLLTDSIDLHTGWTFVFTRKISELQAEYIEGLWVYTNPDALPSYGSPWPPEVLIMAVDKEGICSINWMGASQIKSTLAETVGLEKFDEIKNRIASQLNFVYGTHENANGVGLDIEVDKIELGISLLSEKNKSDVGQYLPTWYVSFKWKWRDQQDSEENWSEDQIMFNAIDGSYVEPRVTNNDLMSNS